MSVYTIRELENLSGIKAHTIRIWEKRYGLIKPQRTSTNIRTYCDTELRKILNVSLLNRNGLKISKIAMMSHDEMNSVISKYSRENDSAEMQVEHLVMAMVEFDEYRFELVLARSVIQYGFEEAVLKVLYPFFVRVGILWQTGSVNPGQEHFISNLVKQKFFTAIDALSSGERATSGRFVFFLPEGELHELGLLFACYLARKRGFRTIYMGQTMPFENLKDVVVNQQVDYLYVSLTSSFRGKDLPGYLKMLADAFPQKNIYLSGYQFAHYQGMLPGNMKILGTPEEFLDELNQKLFHSYPLS
jgi:MerR family transcriptional regulator, light-induced transcriptional regulator